MDLTHRAAVVLKQLILLLIICTAYPPIVHAQSVPGCEFPPVDEPDGDGDECYSPPDPSQSTGNPNNPDTSAPNQPGQQGGEPISYPTGNMFLFQRDYASATVFPLSFDRVYNSQATSTGPLGVNWTDNYAAAIKLVSATTAQAIRGDGKTITFTLIQGLWTAGPAVNSRLSQRVDSSGNTTGWVYKTGDDKTETYDANGLLRSLANRAGVTQTLSYTGGLLTKVADPFGRSLTLTYDVAGRIVALTDPSGRTYAYAYDAQNNLASIRYPDGTTRQYLYENPATPNLLTALVDENGIRYVTWTYDSSGHALSSTFPGGIGRINANYDFVNGSTYVTDALGNTVRYDYFTFGGTERTLHVNRPASRGGLAQNSYLFDPNGNISSYIDFDGNTTNYTFDPSRNLELSRTLADGRLITTTWNPTFRLPTQIQSGSRLDQRSYDSAGNLISQTLTDLGTGLQRTTSFTYNSYGEVLSSTDSNGNRTAFAYDGQGNLVSIRNALGQKTTFLHDADGRVIRATDPNGLLTTYQYDARERLVQKTVGDQRPYRYVYDATGQLVSLKQPSEYNLTLSYDQAHRLIAVSDPFGNQIKYTLDATGNRLSEVHLDATQSVVYTHSRTFDALGRLATTIGASGQTYSYTYNDDGDRLTAADPLGSISSFTYDNVNRLVGSIAADGGTTSYSYDLLDHLVAVTDPRQLVTQFETNALGTTLRVNGPDAGAIAQQADGNGNVISRTDSRGQTLQYQYDALNRLTRIVRADTHQVVYGFNYDEGEPGPHRNGIGRLTSQYDALSHTDYSYDQAGRVIGKSQTIGGNTLRTRSFFDPRSGNLRLVKLPSGAIIHFRWSKGRINEISLIACHDERGWDDHIGDVSDDFWEGCQFTKVVSGIQWEPFGGPSSWRYGNAEQELRTFDLDGRITGESIDSKITYDPASHITAVTQGGAPNILASGTRSYSYDANGRLTAVSSGDNAIKLSYLYDLNGNRLQVSNGTQQTSYTFDTKSNHLLAASPGPTNYAYDGAGNTVQEGTASYTYDVRNRLSSATTTAGTESYYYNGRGQRVEKTGAWGTVVFFYDTQGRLIGEYSKDGRPIQETIYFGNIPVAVLTRQGLFYVHTDYRNAPRQIDDARGMAVWTWDPTSFGVDLPNGRPLAQTGPAFVYNLRFPGQYFDAETGLNYNGNRNYNPRVGRYAEADPIGLKGGLNVYTYVGDNPVSFVDPFGLEGGQPQSTDLWSFLASHPGLVAAIIVTEIVGLGPEDPLADAAVAAEIEAAEAAEAAATAEAEAAQGAIDAQEIATEEEEIVAEEEGATAQEEAAAQDAINQNKLDHIFGNPEHDLDGLVDQYGSQSDAYRAIQEATQTVVNEQGTTGVFETTVNVAGETITVRGTVIDGIVRIGTAFK